MATNSNIRIPDDLLAQLQATAAAEGKSADDLAAEAVKRDLARRFLEKLRRERKPSGMTEEEEIEYVTKVVHEYRAENRGH